MKNALLFICLYVLSNISNGQNKSKFTPPNFKKISKEIAKSKSPYYYPELKKRYMSGDSTMTIEEKRHFYYGYSFQKEYNPLVAALKLFKDSINDLFQKDTLVKADYVSLKRYCEMDLELHPLDLDLLAYLRFAARNLGDSELVSICTNKRIIIFNAILSTGDGKTASTPFFVIDVSHEYDILSILDFKFGGSQKLLKGPQDYLSLQENRFGLEGMYFDVSRCFAGYEKAMKK